ncbi:MAG: S1 RNA-binding domain-containing protein [candidate division WOR-3 bacterium]|nr:S1 RNA-binding domain-containing protein [candidate division WOR-3 bacterium]MCX7947366.1 S1 RNA-binding domain-containing protein [candidate division WOR-3 bacterium]MDW8150078.1 S1 RNA-binding domain-containing protein [candidate division WOR-3 bacterium]
MLAPEQIIERAKKWEIVFDMYDNKKEVKIKIEKKVKGGYVVNIVDLDIKGFLKTKKHFNENDETYGIITSANYINKHIELKLSDSLMDKQKILKILRKAKNTNRSIKSRIVNVHNGGFEISILGQKGFIPPSHIPKKISKNLYSYIGKEVEVYILRINPENILASLRNLEQ